jgi:hypothetical protein
LPIPLDANYGLVVEPRIYLMGGKYDNNILPLKTDATGQLYNWPAGSTVLVEGTFTAGAAGADPGIVEITPATDDELIFMYGEALVGGTKATGGVLWVHIRNASDVNLARFGTYSAAANNIMWIPGLGQDISASGKRPSMRPGIGTMISGTDKMTVDMYNMANTEVFNVYFRFRSLLGSDPTVTGSANGVWA